MKFDIQKGLQWRAQVLTSGSDSDGHLHFIVDCVAETERDCKDGTYEICAMFLTGRVTFWRTRPEIQLERDFVHATLRWKGYARFSVKTTGTIEHDPVVHPEGALLGFGFKERE